LEKRVLIDYGVAQIRIIEDVLSIKSSVLEDPTPLRDVPAQIHIVHHRAEATDDRPSENEHDKKRTELRVQAFIKVRTIALVSSITSGRHRVMEPYRAVALKEKRSP
jgi:hypothetical protein